MNAPHVIEPVGVGRDLNGTDIPLPHSSQSVDCVTPPQRSGVAPCCPACGAGRRRLFGTKNGFTLFRCSHCGVIFTPELVASADLQTLYDTYYDHARYAISPAAAASLETLAVSCEKFRRTGRWLDVGYGEGGLLDIAEQHGWRCYGTEISPASLSFGEKRGWTVTADGENDQRFPAQGFDVVTMIELIEHVPAPDRFLHTAARWLRPGGLLYITTPNAKSLNLSLLGLHWSVVAPPEHLTLWTVRGLRRALGAAGFCVRRVRTHGLNPCELLSRTFRLRPSDGATSRNQAGLALNQALSRNGLNRSLKTAINACLSMLQLGDSLKVSAIRTDRILHRAEKHGKC